jgi:hypothetical protein
MAKVMEEALPLYTCWILKPCIPVDEEKKWTLRKNITKMGCEKLMDLPWNCTNNGWLTTARDEAAFILKVDSRYLSKRTSKCTLFGCKKGILSNV